MQKKNPSITDTQAATPQKRLILIVDDEFDLTSTFSMLFQLNGFETIAANNGQQAVEQMKRHTPDLILSDCMMPIMDGIQLAKHVRSNPASAHIPIILMSGVPQQQSLAETTNNAFIQKPFQFKSLLELTQRLLSSEKTN